MRSALLGVCFADKPDMLRAHVHASTRLTHTDPKAEHGALAVALAARQASRGDHSGATLCRELHASLGVEAGEFLALVDRAADSAAAGESTETFAAAIGLGDGVSGYTYHTVPVALHGWLRHPEDFRAAVLGVVRCGGDTDSTAAITGAIVGAGVGRAGLPADWLASLCEWPQSVAWMESLGRRLTAAEGQASQPLRVNFPGIVVRNLVFLVIVLLLALRRLGPPY
jgi:ADP-ribosyl-[dinitrogen reductase] hydrolase